MKYIAILDHEHLDHSFFMKSFAEAMGRQRGCTGIIIHADSGYTDRLIQTGMMTEDAVMRSTRDLNHRIVALLADNGVSGVGVNGYQKQLVTLSGREVSIDHEWIEARPSGTHLILSNLVRDTLARKIVPLQLRDLADALVEQLQIDMVIAFPSEAGNNPTTPGSASTPVKAAALSAELLPRELKSPPKNTYLGTSDAFGNLPDKSGLYPIF
jgi:hypothetical protein